MLTSPQIKLLKYVLQGADLTVQKTPQKKSELDSLWELIQSYKNDKGIMCHKVIMSWATMEMLFIRAPTIFIYVELPEARIQEHSLDSLHKFIQRHPPESMHFMRTVDYVVDCSIQHQFRPEGFDYDVRSELTGKSVAEAMLRYKLYSLFVDYNLSQKWADIQSLENLCTYTGI